MNDESWVEKYRPEHWGEVQGNNKNLKAIKDWAEDWSPGDSPQFLYGSPGTGKTSTAQVVQKKMGWSMNQVNASDARKTDDIEEISALIQSSPGDGSSRQLILLDEVDSFPGRVNLTPLSDALKDPKSPIILIANKDYEVPNSIKRHCEEREFKLNKGSRRAKLKDIIEQEGLDVPTKDLANLVERPDLRSAINDLQRFAEHGEEVQKDGRDWESSEFEAVDELLGGGSDIPHDIDTEDFMYWIDENFSSNMSDLGKNLRGLELGVIYECLSLSDVYLQRAYDESFRMKKYTQSLQEQTGPARLTETFGGWNKKSFPEWFRSRERKPTENHSEALLYERLSNTDSSKFGIGGDYAYFRRVLLPILKDLPKDERRKLAIEERLDGTALKALNLDEDEFEEWKSGSETEIDMDTEEQSDVMEW